MKDEIIEMLCDINPYVDINENTLLLEEEILDSVGVVLLIQQIEEKYGVHIDIENLDINKFATVITIVNMVEANDDKKCN